jgi:ABC-2 type transport system ATP-binding protein
MHDPKILFLDEPTAGLDPQSRLFLWDIIRNLNGQGLTVLLTTHDMEEAEKLCGRVAIMDHGKILALDTPRKLSQLVPSGTRVELRTRRKSGAGAPEHLMESILSKVRAIAGVTSAEWASAAVAPALPGAGAGNGGWGGAPPMAMPMGKPMPGQFPGPEGQSAEADDGPMLRLYSEGAGEVAVRAAQILLDAGIELADMHLYRPGLEDVFIHLTGKGLRN